jgi:hypothetical protein
VDPVKREFVSNVSMGMDVGVPESGAGGGIPVTLSLDNAGGARLICIGLDYDESKLEFVEYDANDDSPFASEAVTAVRKGNEFLFLCVFANGRGEGGSLDIGTLLFESTESSRPDGGGAFHLMFGDVLDSSGKVKMLRDFDQKLEPVPEVAHVNELRDNYPNPFNPSTIIEYSIARDSHVNLSVYDVAGRLIRTLVNEHQKSSLYRVIWDGTDSRERRVSSGVYFYKLKTGEFSKTKKLVLLR